MWVWVVFIAWVVFCLFMVLVVMGGGGSDA